MVSWEVELVELVVVDEEVEFSGAVGFAGSDGAARDDREVVFQVGGLDYTGAVDCGGVVLV